MFQCILPGLFQEFPHFFEHYFCYFFLTVSITFPRILLKIISDVPTGILQAIPQRFFIGISNKNSSQNLISYCSRKLISQFFHGILLELFQVFHSRILIRYLSDFSHKLQNQFKDCSLNSSKVFSWKPTDLFTKYPSETLSHIVFGILTRTF